MWHKITKKTLICAKLNLETPKFRICIPAKDTTVRKALISIHWDLSTGAMHLSWKWALVQRITTWKNSIYDEFIDTINSTRSKLNELTRLQNGDQEEGPLRDNIAVNTIMTKINQIIRFCRFKIMWIFERKIKIILYVTWIN